MMVWLVLLWTLWNGLWVVPLRGVELCMLFVIEPFCQGRLVSRMGKWSVVAVTHVTCHDIELWPYSVSMLVKWVAFLSTLHWLRVGRILESVVSLMLSCSSFMSFWLVRGCLWRLLFTGTVGWVAQFQCRLFLLVQALILGDLAGLLVRWFVRLLVCLAVFEGSFLVKLVPITAGFGTWVGDVWSWPFFQAS